MRVVVGLVFNDLYMIAVIVHPTSYRKAHSSKDKRRRKDKEDVAKPSGFPWIEQLVKKMIANVSVQVR